MMKILYIGFKGKNNASCQLVEQINPSEKLLLTNSFGGIKRDLASIPLESYDLIIMFGINKNLKDKLIIEVNSSFNCEHLRTKVDYKGLKTMINDYEIAAELNYISTKHLCNYAYHNALLRIKNSIFIHIPGLSKITDFNKIVSVFKDIYTHNYLLHKH